MDWASVVLGAFAAGGLVALAQWLQRLLGAPAPAPAPTPPSQPSAALQAATEALVEESRQEVEEIREAVESDSPESALADMLNRKPPIPIMDEGDQ